MPGAVSWRTPSPCPRVPASVSGVLRLLRTGARLPFDSSHIHGWRNMLTGMEIGEVPEMAVYEGRIRP
jgi:hypothetical protein